MATFQKKKSESKIEQSEIAENTDRTHDVKSRVEVSFVMRIHNRGECPGQTTSYGACIVNEARQRAKDRNNADAAEENFGETVHWKLTEFYAATSSNATKFATIASGMILQKPVSFEAKS